MEQLSKEASTQIEGMDEAMVDLDDVHAKEEISTKFVRCFINNIVTQAKVPFSALHDIDANKPGGSIQIRVKTLAVKTIMLEGRRMAEY